VRDDGSQAGVNDEVRSGIGVTPPEVDSAGIGACTSGGPKVRRADFIWAWNNALRGTAKSKSDDPVLEEVEVGILDTYKRRLID
jgi:hypothetical protein